ncbi:MAG: choice-of-anchor Q domain-containing protein [Dokdonella sp.]
MHKRRHCIAPILAWLVALVPIGAHAAFFCVNSAASLQAALNAAASNGQSDEIDIQAGNYTVVPGGFFYVSNEANSITMFGGFDATCEQRTAARTTFDGSGLYQVMRIIIGSNSTAASVNIQHITFIDGKSTTNSGGGLRVSTLNGNVVLEANRFLLNHANNSAGALYVETSGGISVRNSLFFANDAFDVGAAMLVTSASTVFFAGNTVVSNTAASTLPMTPIGGLLVTGGTGAHLWLSNNILWNNGNGSVDLESSAVFTARNNDIGFMAGIPPDPQSQNNLSVDPAFATCSGLLCLNFNLQRASPLVDAGFDTPLGGIGAFDLEDKPRMIGPHVDIGAYEEDVIFRNGFE